MRRSYIRNHAPSIPVPTLIASGTTSPFGTPYMILEELPGQLLGNRSIDWGALSEDTHRHVERQLATLLLELATLRFDRIGVLAADSVTGKIDVRERPMTVDMQSAARDGTDLDRAFSRDKVSRVSPPRSGRFKTSLSFADLRLRCRVHERPHRLALETVRRPEVSFRFKGGRLWRPGLRPRRLLQSLHSKRVRSCRRKVRPGALPLRRRAILLEARRLPLWYAQGR